MQERRGALIRFFFFQAEDGIRDYKVTGVQTCALPICPSKHGPQRSNARRALSSNCCNTSQESMQNHSWALLPQKRVAWVLKTAVAGVQIGRASCRERV